MPWDIQLIFFAHTKKATNCGSLSQVIQPSNWFRKFLQHFARLFFVLVFVYVFVCFSLQWCFNMYMPATQKI